MNGSIRSRLLKLKLLLFFFLTLASFVSFYFHDSMPDHALSISSNSIDLNYFSYYLFSLVTLIGYYFGPWVFVPFVTYCLFYTFIYSRREYFLDLFNGFLLALFGLGLAWSFFPSSLGGGIRHLMSQHATPWIALPATFFLALLAFWGTFRTSVIGQIFSWGRSFAGLPLRVKLVGKKINPFGLLRRVGKVKSQIPSMLRGEKRGGPPLLVKAAQKPNAPMSVQKNHNIRKYLDLAGKLSPPRQNEVNLGPPTGYFEEIIRQVEDKLAEFGIEGKMVNVLKGPVVDTFELQLGPGVKVSRLMGAQHDLSMALLGTPIRIVYPMLGRATVGIEIPRNPRETIYLSEALASKEFKNCGHGLPLVLGLDAFGKVTIVDLANMPHMLVAGSTGAGKSVFINSLLVSLLMQKAPWQMKLVLIDPKQLELSLYQELPHLAMPVVTTAAAASSALLWAVQEMERRYSILREFGVRNLAGFNEKLSTATPEELDRLKDFCGEDRKLAPLPCVVVVVDEFADLILAKEGKAIEGNLCRLAAKARAAGIHLVLATQRPSVDVITGLIKSNFPTRVSFRVTSAIDSRTILTQTGAEKLLGKGDMLYKHGTVCKRVHSAYVQEEEIEALVARLSALPQDFHAGAMQFLQNIDTTQDSGEAPEASPFDGQERRLLEKAVRLVMEHRTASTSVLQRHLKIGYNRAADLIEELEGQGVIGPSEGAKRRKVLLPPPSRGV